MALGTAGFTAALAIHRMEHNGQRSRDGSDRCHGGNRWCRKRRDRSAQFSHGYEVMALTGKTDQQPYLESARALPE